MVFFFFFFFFWCLFSGTRGTSVPSFLLCLGSVKPELSLVNSGSVGVQWGVAGIAARPIFFCFSCLFSGFFRMQSDCGGGS